jgi:hypothetical protein
MFAPSRVEPLKLAPDMFAPTFYYLPIASTPANFHPNITSTPIYPMTWPIRGYEVAANVDKVTYIYHGYSVNDRLIHTGGRGGYWHETVVLFWRHTLRVQCILYLKF